jgi:DNA-binding LacI/PurR family transcriptional regulator
MSKRASSNAGNLKAIAEHANVSVSLVSKVLNDRLGNSRVSAAKLEAIRASAQLLGYRKNFAASALASGRQNVIGGFVHNIGVPTSGLGEQLVRGMAAQAAKHKNRLMLRFFGSPDDFLAYLSEISPTLLDGVIVAGIHHPELGAQLRRIQEGGVAVITVHEDIAETGFANVTMDQIRVGETGTEHLISRGCRRIAHIAVKPSRFEGYRRAVRRHRLPDDVSLVYEAPLFTYNAGVAAVQHFASQAIEYDGLVCQSDEQAVGALNTLLAMGRRVPDDVKVIGVDDSPLCNTAIVPISSVAARMHRQGATAVDLLIAAIAGEKVKSAEIEPRLTERASTSDATEGPFDRSR